MNRGDVVELQYLQVKSTWEPIGALTFEGVISIFTPIIWTTVEFRSDFLKKQKSKAGKNFGDEVTFV